ncbi:helix-turn-helix domain-containing protein [Paraburkholderia sp. JHI869]|uniref:helix-turn-helix domain-containing protein n=1 Tax=Paraburkholderia sp. JHI869 TaxID=3112959 RepID=UPI003177D9F0
MECESGSERNRGDEFHTFPDLDEGRKIGVYLCAGFSLSELASVLELFESANTQARLEHTVRERTCYEISLLSLAGGRVSSSSSVFVWTESVEDSRYADGFDTLFVASGAGMRDARREDRLIRWLRQEGPRCRAVVPIGEGGTLIEAAGIAHAATALAAEEAEDARRHEHAASDFSGTTTGPLQEVLALIEQDLGISFARMAAANVMPSPQRARIGIIAGLRKTTTGHVSERIQAAAVWLEANGVRAVAIDDAAKIAAMSERNFLRRFKVEIGVTPSDYLLYVRIDMSCRLLIETDLPVDKVARRSGLGSGSQLAKLFRKHLETTPTEYRSRHRRVKARNP